MHFQCISCFFSPGQWWRDDSTAAEHHHFLCADWSETRGGVHREPGGPPRPGSKPACQSHRHHMYVLSTKHNFMLGFSGIYYSKHNTLQSQSTKMLNLNYIWRRPPPLRTPQPPTSLHCLDSCNRSHSNLTHNNSDWCLQSKHYQFPVKSLFILWAIIKYWLTIHGIH